MQGDRSQIWPRSILLGLGSLVACSCFLSKILLKCSSMLVIIIMMGIVQMRSYASCLIRFLETVYPNEDVANLTATVLLITNSIALHPSLISLRKSFPCVSLIMTINHVFSAFSFISFVLVSIPFAWHLEAWNTATCLHMFWLSISNLAFFVNSVLWDGNVVNWSPVWCDISGRLVLAVNIAIPATCICIQRRLYHTILNPAVTATRAKIRQLVMIDIMIGLGLPILSITLAYVVQAQRYQILGDFGCHIPVVNTSLGVVLVPALKLSISLASGVYGCINAYNIWIRRQTIKSTIGCSGNLKFSRYIRLFVLSGIDILITIPVNIWAFTTWFPVHPWLSWTAIHANFSRVDTYPAAQWRGDRSTRMSLEGGRWISVVYALIFFILFGFADEARKHYRFVLQSIAKKVGYQTRPSGSFEPQVSEHLNSLPLNSIYSPDLARLTTFSKSRRPTPEKSNSFESLDGKIRCTSVPATKYDSDSNHELEFCTVVGHEEFVVRLTTVPHPAHFASSNVSGSGICRTQGATTRIQELRCGVDL